MISQLRSCLCLFFLIFSLSLSFAEEQSYAIENEADKIASAPVKTENLAQIELLSEEQTVQPGHPFWVAIHFKIQDHWHAYWKNAGYSGMPPSIEWNLPDGFQVSELNWPYPDRFNLNSVIGYGYGKDFILLAKITPPNAMTANSVELALKSRWVLCSDSTCVPGASQAKLTLPVLAQTPKIEPLTKESFAQARALLPQKHPTARVERKNGLLELSFELPDLEKPLTAYFCPEESNLIDEASEAVLSSKEGQKGHYTLALRDDTSAEPASALKGVIVLSFDEATNLPLIALEVDAPIALPPQQEIGMVPQSRDLPKSQINSGSGADESPDGLAIVLFFAFIGGFLLNLMPCVLPVVSLKILSFVKMAGQKRSLTLKHGLSFSLGVLISFWVMAAMLIVLQAYGRSAGWGFQLQEPLFVAILAAVLLVLALSLFGVLEIGAGLASLAGRAQGPSGSLVGSFGSGVLATAVATPCTGPFLGSAIGFAMASPAFVSMLIFTSLALGMIFPYLLLSAYPSLLRFLPKPGAWMITFKELMGFFMLATVLWLLWVFAAQTNSLAVVILLGSFFFFALGCWIYGRWATPIRSKTSRYIGTLLTLACFVLGGYILWNTQAEAVLAYEDSTSLVAMNDTKKHGVWEEFSPERVAELQQQGIPVLVDFTAKWCLICQANHLVLSTDSVSQKITEKGVVRMKADWTRSDPVITEELRKFGRNGVPLYLLYGTNADEAPQILPQVLTPDIVMEALEKIEHIPQMG